MNRRLSPLAVSLVVSLATALLLASSSALYAQEPPSPGPSYRQGAIFGGGLGGMGLMGARIGDGGFSGYARVGYWLTDRLALSFQWHGLVGPRPGPESFSLLTWGGRFDIHLAELSPGHDLYLIAIPGTTRFGTQGRTGAMVPINDHFEFSFTGGAGVRLKEFGYVRTSFEAMALSVLSGPDRFVAVGGFLTLWFRTDAGLVGTADTY